MNRQLIVPAEDTRGLSWGCFTKKSQCTEHFFIHYAFTPRKFSTIVSEAISVPELYGFLFLEQSNLCRYKSAARQVLIYSLICHRPSLPAVLPSRFLVMFQAIFKLKQTFFNRMYLCKSFLTEYIPSKAVLNAGTQFDPSGSVFTNKFVLINV